MSKKQKIYIIIACLGVVSLVLAAFLLFSPRPQETPVDLTPKPTPTLAETPTPLSPQEEVDSHKILAATSQYKEGNEVGAPLEIKELGDTPSAYVPLSINTANKYVQNSIFNPYFIAGWWGQKDNYGKAALDKYVTPYLSDELKEQYYTALEDPDSQAFKDFYTSKVFLPSENLTVNPYCFDTWTEGSCFGDNPEPQITNIVATGVDPNTVKLNMTVELQPIYQDNEQNGDLVLQPRVYKFSMVLTQNIPVAEGENPELPIMVIESISSSLEIQDSVTYITNVEN